MLVDIQIPDFKMIIRRRNTVLRLILHIGNRGFGTLVCNPIANIVQKSSHPKKSTHRIATFLCNPIANIVQKIIASKKSTHRIATYGL